MKKLSIIIPVYNEEQFVGQLLEKIVALDLAQINYEKEIIVINDGSKDKSDQIIKKFMEEHKTFEIKYTQKENGGKWSALKAGFAQATWDLFIVQDADLEYDPHDYFHLIKKIDEWKDFVYGSRTTWYIKYTATYSTFWFLLGWLVVSLLTSILWWTIVTDEPTCYKLFTSKLKEYLISIPEDGFEREPAITITLLKKWYTYAELPIRYYPRDVQHGKKIKLIDGRIAIKTLFKYRFN